MGEVIEKSGFIAHLQWWMPLCVIALFLFGTFVPYRVFKHKNTERANKFASRQWILVVAWFSAMLFVLFLNGEFIKSGVSQVIVGCSAGLSAMFSLSSTIEKISIQKGGFRLDADMLKKEEK